MKLENQEGLIKRQQNGHVAEAGGTAGRNAVFSEASANGGLTFSRADSPEVTPTGRRQAACAREPKPGN